MAEDRNAQERWTSDGLYDEYSKAANPIGAGLISKVPMADFPHHLHESGPTQIIPFDLSEAMKCPGPATSPALCSNFIHIRPGERIRTAPNATSELYYVIRGTGSTRVHDAAIRWARGEFLTFPARSVADHAADADAAFYWVHDEPLLPYLGVTATTPRFRPTLYPSHRARMELERVEQEPIQDAGLHTYLRTLDIHFVHKDPKVYISQKG